LLLAVCGLGIPGSKTEAADPADAPASDASSASGEAREVNDEAKHTKLAGLPHRQEWELFRQGYSPARDCPGGTAMLIEVSGSVFFLECQRIQP